MIVGGIYYRKNYPDQDFEQLLFYMFSGVEHTAPAVVNHVLAICVAPVILLTAIIWLPTTEFAKEIKIKGKQLYPCKFIVKHKKIYLAIIYIIATTTLILGFQIHEYIYNRVQKTHIYEEHYVKADEVKIEFPEEKRNLIVIIAESMENSICSKTNGGGWSYSVIPELEQLAKENFERRKEIYLLEGDYDYEEDDEHDMLNTFDLMNIFIEEKHSYHAYVQNIDAGVYIIVAKGLHIIR